VVFDGIGLRRALEVCERLRAAVEAAPWAAIAPGLAVTISTGLCDAGAHDSVANGLARVDGLLYEAKRSGRNRVVPG
jgi:PleD family two-component response regulator